MSEAPEKIWYDSKEGYAYEKETYLDDPMYIRADLVDELAQALKWIMAILPIETETDVKAIDRAKTALAKVKTND